MSRLSKLVKDPRRFVRDSKLYQRYFAPEEETGSRSTAEKPDDAGPERRADERRPKGQTKPKQKREMQAKPKPKPTTKSHPLPTLNLSEETELSEGDLARISAERRFLCFDASPTAQERVIARLAERVRDAMVGAGFSDRDWAADIRDFLQSFEKNPAAGAARTTAEGSLLWLFVIARAIGPKVIVESGVFKGASLFTLRAASPTATLYGYEPDLSNLLVRDGTIRLHAGDWSEAPPRAEGPDDFCYFDDHISNCLRVRQAWDLGFRHLVFDDSPDIGQLHRWRYPGVPTIQMVVRQTLQPGEWVEWVWKNRKLRYVHREEDTHGVRDLVESIFELPSLDALTGRATGVQTYVRLKRRDR